MNLSRTTQPTVGAGAGVYFGSGLVDRGEGGSVGAVSGGGACARWTRRCSTMRAPPKDTITQLAGSAAAATIRSTRGVRCARFGKQTATGPREFGIHESDGAPDEKESRPKHEPPGYQACMMAR